MGALKGTFRQAGLGVLIALAACSSGGGGSSSGSDSGSDEQSSDPGTPPPPTARLLRVTTFNAGLLPFFVPGTDERVGPVAQAAAAHDTDVLCLQEVWRAGDQQTIANGLHSTYPFITIPPAHQKFASALPVCSASELEPVASCALTDCLSGSIGIYECLIGTCHDELNALGAQDPECAEAITAQAGKSALDILDIEDQLLGGSTPAGLFPFDGSSGLMLASRLPLEDVQVVDFFDITTTSRRAAILATVTKDGARHRIGCTHLQSNLDGLVPYTGQFGTYGGEQLAQAERLISSAASYSGSDPQYLAGDFNCSRGSSAKGVADDLGGNCGRFLSAGYADPAADQLGCTFCSSNLVNGAKDDISETRDTLLDHVFVKNPAFAGATAERVFTQEVSISGASSNLSDHFGVRLSAPVP